MKKYTHPGLRISIEYVVERLQTALKYGPDMATSCELALKDAAYILSNAIRIEDEREDTNGN